MGITGKRFWLERGFIPSEADAYKNISTEAIKDSRYIKVMIETRMRRYREFYQEYDNVRNVLPIYRKYIRKQYVKRGITSNASDLVLSGDTDRRNKVKTLAFEFFNQYKDKYAIRDNSGKVVKTPRKKTRASKKPITGNKSIDQTIRKIDDDIKYKEYRKRFADDAGKKQLDIEVSRLNSQKSKLKQQKNK